MELAGGNPSIRLTPFPTVNGSTLQRFLQIGDCHWIKVNPNIFGEETSEGLQKSALEIGVDVFKRSNHQGKTCDEAHRRLCMAVYESSHVVELGLAKKQHVAAGGRSASMRRIKSGISGAGSFGVNEAAVRQKNPAGADFVSPSSF